LRKENGPEGEIEGFPESSEVTGETEGLAVGTDEGCFDGEWLEGFDVG
jgi:hypothetical protein